MITPTDRARFEAKVMVSDGCWEWIGSKTPQGYGSFWHNGRLAKAHRFSVLLSGSEIPEGMIVMHKCDNPGCVRHDHLIVGTQAMNVADCVSKKRNGAVTRPDRQPRGERSGSFKHPERYPRGSAHHQSKLTEGQVVAIRERATLGERHRAMAAEYGVSTCTIDRIVAGRLWKHLPLAALAALTPAQES